MAWLSIICYRYHTFLATLIQFVDIEVVIFVSLGRRLIHRSVHYWTFVPYSGYQSHVILNATKVLVDINCLIRMHE